MRVIGFVCPRCHREVPVDSRFVRYDNTPTMEPVEAKTNPKLKLGEETWACPLCFHRFYERPNFIEVEVPDDWVLQ